MQSVGGGNSLKVTATVKHFAGYSESINGIPATASRYLLTTLLRDRLGFKGVVISDYADVPALASTYHLAADLAGAAALAVNAGVGMAMLPFNADQWQTAMQQHVKDGSITVARINKAVRRILTLKFQLGLFDHSMVDAGSADAAAGSGRDATLQVARESIALLRHQNNVLPLSPGAHVVVTGPSADSMTNQPVSAVLVPAQRLVGLTRVTLDPGQSQTVQVSFRVIELAVTPGDIDGTGSPQVELGAYQAQVGSMSATSPSTADPARIAATSTTSARREGTRAKGRSTRGSRWVPACF